MTVSADLPGIVEKIYFESGQTVGAGAVLVRLDTKQEQAQLAAAEAARDLSDLNLKRAKGPRRAGDLRAGGPRPARRRAEAGGGEGR